MAYDPFIRNMSGVDALQQQYGDWFSYWSTPRGLIFARDAPKVASLDDMKALMRYSNYTHEPYSTQLNTCAYLKMTNCTPPYTSENIIATRGDLNPADGVYALPNFAQRNHVATDSKIAVYSQYDPSALTVIAQR